MIQAKAADNKPHVIELEPKQYFWCACGESKKQPFCDGSHVAGGAHMPVPFTITEKKTVALCMCKRTQNAPFCDGSHAQVL